MVTCNRVELYADVATFRQAAIDQLAACSPCPGRSRRAHVTSLCPLRGRRRIPSVPRGKRARLDGRRRKPDPRSGSRGLPAGSGRGDGQGSPALFPAALRVGKRCHAETGIDSAGRGRNGRTRGCGPGRRGGFAGFGRRSRLHGGVGRFDAGARGRGCRGRQPFGGSRGAPRRHRRRTGDRVEPAQPLSSTSTSWCPVLALRKWC